MHCLNSLNALTRFSRWTRLSVALLAPALVGCTGDDSATATDSSAATSETTSATATDATTTTGSTDATVTATSTATSTATDPTTTTTTDPTTTTTTATTTTTTTGGDPVACTPPNLPPEGSPCANEGEFCSPGCEDPCEFCNVVTCEGGAWQGLEVFPAECLSCDEVCPAVVAAGCQGGPPDLDACVAGCGDNEAKCTLPFHKMLACIGPRPTYTCDGDERPLVVGCEAEFAELYLCIFP